MESREEILRSLEPLYAKAVSERLIFWCRYQDLHFTPRELREAQAAGRYVWGAGNWELVEPGARIRELEDKVERARSAAANFRERLVREGYL